MRKAEADFELRGRRSCSGTAAQAETALSAAEAHGPRPRPRKQMHALNGPKPKARCNALRAEVGALADWWNATPLKAGRFWTAAGSKGYEKALGAALADDLRAPESKRTAARAGRSLPRMTPRAALPDGVTAVDAIRPFPRCWPAGWRRVGLGEADEGARLQAS